MSWIFLPLIFLYTAAVIISVRRSLLPKGPIDERVIIKPGQFYKMEREILGHPENCEGLPKFLAFSKTVAINPDQAEHPSSEDDNLPGNISASNGKGKDGSLDVSTIAATADGVTPALEYSWTWAHVDQHLFQAAEQLTHETCQHMSDLSRIIKEHEWSASALHGVSDGLVNKIKGHVAEFVVADHLVQAGHEVMIPPTSNQPGYDLIIDGDHPVNVKLVEDAGAAIRSHHLNYPDIPVIVPQTAEHIPEDALHFDPSQGLDIESAHDVGTSAIVDDALSNPDVTEMTHDGLDVADGQVEFHIPWITMGFSSYREIKLLLDDHTDLLRASKNILSDVAGVGVGGGVGMKIGAVVGSLAGPIGTAFGAGMGGYLGAQAGRWLAKEFKLAPLHEAQEAYKGAFETFEQERQNTIIPAEKEWKGFERKVKRDLLKQIKEAESYANDSIVSAKDNLDKAKYLKATDFYSILEAARAELLARVHEILNAYKKFPVWRRWIWPSPEVDLAGSAYKVFRNDVRHWESAYKKLKKKGSGSIIESNNIFDLALVTKSGLLATEQFIINLGLVRAAKFKEAERATSAAISQAIAARATAIEQLNNRQKEISDQINACLKPIVKTLKSTRNKLVKELRKAGIDVNE